MTDNDFQASVAAFTAELRGLFAPAEAEAAGFAPTEDLADRADRLAAHASALTNRTAAFLADDDPSVRLGAEQHLLAQAAASIRVADGLLAAAAAEEGQTRAMAGLAAEPAGFDDLLAIIESPLAAPAAMQAGFGPAAADATQAQLIATSSQTIDTLLGGVTGFAQDTLAGLLGLDTALIRQAAQMISADLGDLVARLGAEASRLVSKAVSFLVRAYDSLLAALGQEATSELRQQAAKWLQQLQEGDTLTGALKAIFRTDATQQKIEALVEASSASAPVLGQTQAAVLALDGSFQARTKLANQLLAGLGVLKRIPATRIPMVELASAAVYISLLGFIVYLGADYVDAPNLERLGRISGVLHTVETGLATA